MSDEAPRKIISIDFYRQENGKEPVREWLKSLMKMERRIIGEDIKMVQEGWPLGMPLVKNLGKGLSRLCNFLGPPASSICSRTFDLRSNLEII